MSWRVDFTDEAKAELRSIYWYIHDVLLEPQTALAQIRRIKKATDALDQLPFRYRLYDQEPWRSRGLRILPVNNYLVFYVPDESRCVVEIVHIIYGGRDIEAQVEQSE